MNKVEMYGTVTYMYICKIYKISQLNSSESHGILLDREEDSLTNLVQMLMRKGTQCTTLSSFRVGKVDI